MAFGRKSEQPENACIIAVMGVTGAGKSTFIHNATQGGSAEVGHGLNSCTQDIEQFSLMLDGQKVILMDTPGFDDTTRSDTDVLKAVAAYLTNMYEKGTKLSGLIFLHRISDPRMPGGALRNLRMFRQLVGDDAISSVALTTTFWEKMEGDQREYEKAKDRESELFTDKKFWEPMIRRGARTARLMNSPESARAVIRPFLKLQPIAIQIQKEIIDDNKTLGDTDAGKVLDEDLKELVAKQAAELEEMQQSIKDAIQMKDQEMRELLEDERREMKEKMDAIQEEQRQLFEAGRLEQERKLQEQKREMEAEREREREHLRKEKEAEREHLRKEREAEREQQRREKEEQEKRAQAAEIARRQAEAAREAEMREYLRQAQEMQAQERESYRRELEAAQRRADAEARAAMEELSRRNQEIKESYTREKGKFRRRAGYVLKAAALPIIAPIAIAGAVVGAIMDSDSD